MNQKLFEKRLNNFYQNFDTESDRIQALREVIRQSPQGQSYRRTLCKGFANDAQTNDAIADVCNAEILRLSGYKQLTVFDALRVGGVI